MSSGVNLSLIPSDYSLTMFSIRFSEKKSWNTSKWEAEIGMVGPTGDLNDGDWIDGGRP